MKAFTILVALLSVIAVPVKGSVLVTNGLTHRHDVTEGQYDRGVVVLKNVGDTPERVVVYFQDLKVGCNTDDDLSYSDPGTSNRSNAQWLKVSLKERVLEPGEEFPLRYEINIPDSQYHGSFWSLLMVEIKKPIDTTQLQYGVRVNSNVRYAVQIITDFNSPKATEVEFTEVSFENKGDEKMVMITLENHGDKVLIPMVRLEVYDKEGELLLEQKADTKKLYPNQCRSFSIPVSDLAKGNYQGVLVADCGESDLFGMTLNLEVDDR